MNRETTYWSLIKPTLYYIATIAVSHTLGSITILPIRIFSILTATLFPIILLAWNIEVLRNIKGNVTNKVIFALSAIPGILLVLQLFSEITEMQFGYFPTRAILPTILIAIITGGIFGLIGMKLFQLAKSQPKRKIMRNMMVLASLGVILGFIIDIAVFSLYAEGLPSHKILVYLSYCLSIPPMLMSGSICEIFGDATFGCLAVNFYTSPIYYAVLCSLIYLIYIKLKRE